MILLQTLVISFSGAAAPGPLMMVAMAQGLRQGAEAGVWVALGHAVLEAALVAAVAVGLAQALQSASWTAGIAVVGGLVLLAMGGSQLYSAKRGDVAAHLDADARLETVPGKSRVRRRAWSAGMAATVSNPYWYVWWLTVGAALITQIRSWGWGALPLFFAAHWLADLVWLTLVAWAAGRGRARLSVRGYQLLLSSLAVLLILFGVFFLQSGVRQLVT